MTPQRKYRHIAIAFHPKSGKGLAERRVHELETRLTPHGFKIQRLDTSQLAPAALGEALSHPDAVVVVGGDGLIHHVIKHLAHSNIPLGIIPAGSGNDTWRMSASGTAEESLHDVVKFLIAEDQGHPVDLLELTFMNQATAATLAIGAVSWGFEGLVNARANNLPRSLGALRYVVAMLLSLAQLRAEHTEVRSEEFTYSGPIYVASIANICSIGGGLTLFPQANYGDGLADISLVTGPRILPIVPFVGHILRGKKHPFQLIARSTRVQVQTTANSYADGEWVGQGDFELQVLKHALLLMAGADSR